MYTVLCVFVSMHANGSVPQFNWGEQNVLVLRIPDHGAVVNCLLVDDLTGDVQWDSDTADWVIFNAY